MPLDLQGDNYRKQLEQIQSEQHAAVEADITTEGIGIGAKVQKSWFSAIAYLQKKWKGDTVAGAKITIGGKS